MKLMTFTMIFSGGTIPTFIVVKSLGLMNKYGALWFPGLITVYNLIVMKTFFEQMPESLEEAARIDGAGDILIFLQNSSSALACDNRNNYAFLCGCMVERIFQRYDLHFVVGENASSG
ncbi:MAG: ABC transporter permease subunit [Clostridiales bacterium]|nr:MAG: ABC transporter permease subunit [Clostridiales bacterium]